MNRIPRSGGLNPQAGITAQNWAALSMFVQQTFDPSFVKIQMEKSGLADFVLVFQARRIICESKNYDISYPKVKAILDAIPAVGTEDEIVIICKGVKDEVVSRLNNAKYFPEVREWLSKEKSFTSRHLDLLPKLNFWIVDQSINEAIVKNLMEQRFNIWLPSNDLVYATLVEKIFKQSATGGEYTKAEFIADVQKYREHLAENDDSSLKTKPVEDRVREIIADVLDPKSRLASSRNPLQVLVTTPAFHDVALAELEKQDTLDLREWDLFWQATYGSYLSREVFSVLNSKVTDTKNAEYAISFVKNNADSLRYKIYDEFQYKEAADLLDKACTFITTQDTTVAELLIKFFGDAKKSVFFVQKRHSNPEWILGELALSLKKLYSESNDPEVRAKILQFIDDSFHLIEDESSYWHETPPPVFDILRERIGTSEERLRAFIAKISSNYDKFYRQYTRQRPAFRGWDLFGGGTGTWGGDVHVEDRRFLESVILPCLRQMKKSDATRILDDYIETDEEKVSYHKPDFMNRASIPLLIEDYINNDGRESALVKLTAFVKMRRGIPDKRELIYQAIKNSDMTSDQKWELLKIGIDEYGQPVNVFMDQILWQLFDVGHEGALSVFSSLLTNDAYMARQSVWNSTVPQAISRIIGNEKTLEQGVSILETYLLSKQFNKLGIYEAYDLKSAINTLLGKKPDIGMSVLNQLLKGKPSQNQQAVFSAVLRDMIESLKLRVYEDLIDPLLEDASTAASLADKLTLPDARESIVWFGEKLAKGHANKEALRIAKFLINDPDPAIISELDQHILEGKLDSSITTVRGSIPWILMQFSTVGGQDYLPEVFQLTKQLCTDKSLYVREQGMLSLELLVNARHTRLPDSEEWFMPYELASQIEEFAFTMLHDDKNYYPAILKRLAGVFTRIRTVNETQALEVIEAFQNQDGEVFEELASYTIFMAEFRQDRLKDWPSDRGSISKYNPLKVQEKLKDLLENGTDEVRRTLASRLSSLPEEVKNNEDVKRELIDTSLKYLPLLTKKYEHLVFESIYRFVGQYIEVDYASSYQLWRKALDAERPAIINESKIDGDGRASYTWWPYFKNGSILLKIANRDFAAFLEGLEYLLGYPDSVNIANDIQVVVDYLATTDIDRNAVDRIFKKLLERNPRFFHRYQEWQDGLR